MLSVSQSLVLKRKRKEKEKKKIRRWMTEIKQWKLSRSLTKVGPFHVSWKKKDKWFSTFPFKFWIYLIPKEIHWFLYRKGFCIKTFPLFFFQFQILSSFSGNFCLFGTKLFSRVFFLFRISVAKFSSLAQTVGSPSTIDNRHVWKRH